MMLEDLSVLSDINISQLIETYAVPWSINIVMALAIFVVGRLVVKLLVPSAPRNPCVTVIPLVETTFDIIF